MIRRVRRSVVYGPEVGGGPGRAMEMRHDRANPAAEWEGAQRGSPMYRQGTKFML